MIPRLSLSQSRRRRSQRRSISSSSCLMYIVIFLSLRFDDSLGWTMIMRTTIKSTKSLNSLRPRQRRRLAITHRFSISLPSTSTTAIRQSSIVVPNDKAATIDAKTTTTIDNKPSSQTITGANDTAWDILGGNIATCLIASDLKRDSGFDGSSTGWTSWVEQSSAFRLQKCIDKLDFCDYSDIINNKKRDEDNEKKTQQQRDDTLRWLKWMKASPAPMIVELSNELRFSVDGALTKTDYDRIGQSRTEFLSRIGCRLILLPSGSTLFDNLRTPPGAMVYGKLCYGGVTRYRLLGGGRGNNNVSRHIPRKVGERTTIIPSKSNSNSNSNSTDIKPTVEGWLQYGGPERNYEAVDMGPCGLMEITILPKGLKLGLLSGSQEQEKGQSHEAIVPSNGEDDGNDDVTVKIVTPKNSERQPTEEMIVTQANFFNPQWLFSFSSLSETETNNSTTIARNNDGIFNVNDSKDNYEYYGIDGIERKFSTVLGGLQNEIQSIIRRVLDGRQRTTDLSSMLDLGLSPVRGLLLYGKPGCGKTALAREISRLLTDRPPKIVAAPELLDRWVGGTESSVRALFADAESELAVCNGDTTLSGLHVVVIDEIDAVFRKRSSSSGSGEVARASAVNQILSKLDGMQALGNVLVIGTTNRRDLLDDALLRPGRLEVKIEVPLPDQEGRREILKIYFDPLRSFGRLSQPLCHAIDGTTSLSTKDDVRIKDPNIMTRSFLPDRIRRIRILKSLKVLASPGTMVLRDLASDRWTGGFSGADLEGLVRCAGSIALSRARNDGSGVDGLLITTGDVTQALREVKQ